MKQYGLIYKITNKVNNKLYIGQTTSTLKTRWKMHKTASRNNRSNSALHSAMAKYGINQFIIEEICSCFDKEELNLKEIYFIDTLNGLAPNGYNLKLGGDVGKWSKIAKNEFSLRKKKQYKDNPLLKDKLNDNFNSWYNGLSKEEQDTQLKLQSMASKEYWSNEDNKFKKSDEEVSRWKELTEEDKSKRLMGMRTYWTENKLKEHSKLMKDRQLWKETNCLQKAVEATSKRVKVIEISTGKEIIYSSRAKCTKDLKLTAQTLIDILSGKRSNEYKGYRFFSMN